MQSIPKDKLVEYYCSTNEVATESAKYVTKGIKTMFSKIFSSFEDDTDEEEIFQTISTENTIISYGYNNPLLIDLIVKNVMKYLPLKDLRNCRQVCKLWNAEAGAFFRRQQSIIFYPESIDKMASFTAFMKAEEQDTENKKLPPFTKFCFTAQFPSTQFPKHMMDDFIEIYGRHVKTVEIFYPNDSDLSGTDLKRFFIKGMPNLESIHLVNLPLTLTQSNFLTDSDKCNLVDYQWHSVVQLKIDRTWQIETCWKPNFLCDLLSLMPCLEDYEVWTWNSTEDAHSKPYLISVSSEQKENLKSLRPGSIGEDLGHSLADLGLKLKKLFLPVLNRDISAKTLEALLFSQKNTLEEFQLNCSSLQNSRFIQFPRLSCLKSLHMIITYPWNNKYVVFSPTIDYKTQMPLLESFKLELAVYIDLGFSNYFFPPNGVTVSPSLKELDLSFNGFRDDKFIGTLSQIFPNLVRFKLNGYGNRIFSSICFHMQNLEQLELVLIYGFNVDDQLTGIPKDVCAKWRKDQNYASEEMQQQFQIFPSLSSMHKLQRLSMRQKDYQAKFWPDSQCITELTVYFALVHMKQLTHLQIQSIKFSDDCMKFLSSSLQNCWIDVL